MPAQEKCSSLHDCPFWAQLPTLHFSIMILFLQWNVEYGKGGGQNSNEGIKKRRWIDFGIFFWCSCPLFPCSSSKPSSVISVWVLLATWRRFSLQKCMLAARKTYPLTFSSHFLWKAQVSFSLTVKNVWRGKGKRTSSLQNSRMVLFSMLCTKLHIALFALCSVPSGKRSGRKSKCKLSR